MDYAVDISFSNDLNIFTYMPIYSIKKPYAGRETNRIIPAMKGGGKTELN